MKKMYIWELLKTSVVRSFLPIFFIMPCVLIGGTIHAQDFGFGFGFDDGETAGASGSTGSALNVSINGDISASMLGYIDDFSGGAEKIQFGDIFSGKLNFSAKTSIADGVINLKLQPTTSPLSIDEAYLRAYFGSFEIAAGLRKLTWGKADSFGPLDVINPLDYSQIFTEMADNISLMDIKIARPLVHASFRFGQSSKIEGVFVPWFEPHNIPKTGRWSPAQMRMLTDLPESIEVSIPSLDPITVPIELTEPEIEALDYAQAGLRFTTTIGSADIGAQYYYGRMPQPAAKIKTNINIPSVDVNVLYLYNPYHQIGLDYAQVLFGFNIRAELAANITEDMEGDDGSVYNPSIAWSFGFDRDLVWGINLNLQANESIRLMHDKLGAGNIRLLRDKLSGNEFNIGDMMEASSIMDNFDIEGGSRLTATRLTAIVSKKFLRDELELRTAVAWGIEDNDCFIMPALIWTKDDLRIALSGGFFIGDSEGQLGQYKDNHFLKISLEYTF